MYPIGGKSRAFPNGANPVSSNATDHALNSSGMMDQLHLLIYDSYRGGGGGGGGVSAAAASCSYRVSSYPFPHLLLRSIEYRHRRGHVDLPPLPDLFLFLLLRHIRVSHHLFNASTSQSRTR